MINTALHHMVYIVHPQLVEKKVTSKAWRRRQPASGEVNPSQWPPVPPPGATRLQPPARQNFRIKKSVASLDDNTQEAGRRKRRFTRTRTPWFSIVSAKATRCCWRSRYQARRVTYASYQVCLQLAKKGVVPGMWREQPSCQGQDFPEAKRSKPWPPVYPLYQVSDNQRAF